MSNQQLIRSAHTSIEVRYEQSCRIDHVYLSTLRMFEKSSVQTTSPVNGPQSKSSAIPPNAASLRAITTHNDA